MALRSSILFVLSALIIGVTMIWLWPSLTSDTTASVPGQYPITASRPQWPVSERVAYYRPGAAMGSDMVTFPGGSDAKGRCATSNTCAEFALY
jgi:hypothetical protein